ncbi:hypothetical protein VKT23_010717 [Stygiomarasmius scandens]|uniref:Uncharacterized protein n=1 Tax=Marasmiellus scandens TaxID=2682957 RepID=A0ABR1JGV4_9AGAR
MKWIVATGSNTVDTIYEPYDFDPDFDRVLNAGTNLTELFKDVIGCEDIINQLRRYQEIARFGKENAKDIRNLVATNFVFKGPPDVANENWVQEIPADYWLATRTLSSLVYVDDINNSVAGTRSQ